MKSYHSQMRKAKEEIEKKFPYLKSLKKEEEEKECQQE